MHILIAGSPHSGQRETLELLTSRNYDNSSLSGLVTNHTFTTKYFSTPCGLWVDEITDYTEWVNEFSSPAAKEVRDSLVLFIYTYDPVLPDHLTAAVTELAKFTDVLAPGTSVAVARSLTPLLPTSQDPSTQITHILTESGFDIISHRELVNTVHSALYDAVSDSGAEDSDENDIGHGPSRDLHEIVKELVTARDSEIMTDDEKRALAERLARELV